MVQFLRRRVPDEAVQFQMRRREYVTTGVRSGIRTHNYLEVIADIVK
jgi:hypothetical protein